MRTGAAGQEASGRCQEGPVGGPQVRSVYLATEDRKLVAQRDYLDQLAQREAGERHRRWRLPRVGGRRRP